MRKYFAVMLVMAGVLFGLTALTGPGPVHVAMMDIIRIDNHSDAYVAYVIDKPIGQEKGCLEGIPVHGHFEDFYIQAVKSIDFTVYDYRETGCHGKIVKRMWEKPNNPKMRYDIYGRHDSFYRVDVSRG